MRTFYIFKIKKHFTYLTKNSPYHLYKTIENFYYVKPRQIPFLTNAFDNLKDKINDKILNETIYEEYKDKYTYTKYKNTHMLNDYYTKEKTRMVVDKNFILITTTKEIPTFLKVIPKKNLFVCDFENKEYFWLEELA